MSAAPAKRPADALVEPTPGDRAELDAYIAEVVATAPPLTAEQADRVALLFRRAPRSEKAAA
ncbi:hypothetical protein [Blastococcus mobilis]|uniref:Uncharacterized protein n=1 Tax=Blastococcus mobilis TaxID=1938746 RepID=A0A239AIC9_9ACTN|nr:hypothetical protein [Blastococcus mobilis]SNR95300.1 hypothetical protein SAMN06272737_1464 [Blastococcus mobilis]